MLEMSLPTLIFTVLNILVLYLFLKKFLFKPVTAMMEKRTETITANLEAAEAAKVEANRLKEEYEARHGQSTPASDMPDMYDVNALDNAQLRQQLSDSQNLAASYLQENDELKALLSDKDAQIATLTQELEQLKEQLDKLPKRTTTRKKEPTEDVEAEAVATEQAGA